MFFLCVNMNKQIRYTWLAQMFGNISLLKAMAVLLLVRKRHGSTIAHFTYNKLHDITGMHPDTLKKRIKTLADYNLVSIEGETITFRSITSRHNKRNSRLSKVDYTNVKTVLRSLQAILVVNIQLHKEYIKRVIRQANGHDLKKVKAARRTLRRYGYTTHYEEYGLGYKKIAKELGCCKQTAESIVGFAVGRKMMKKTKNVISHYMKGVWYQYVEGYTYTTRNYAVKVLGNIYSVADAFSAALVGV